MIDCLGRENRLDKGNPPGHVYELSVPRGKLSGTLVLKVLEVPSPKAPNRERETEVSQRKCCTRGRDVLKDNIKINGLTTDRHDGALREVGAKAGDLSKMMKNGSKVLNVFLDRRHKHRRVIRVKRGTQNDSSSPKLAKKPNPSRLLENLSDRVNGKHKKE
jgi:hypothetical protein